MDSTKFSDVALNRCVILGDSTIGIKVNPRGIVTIEQGAAKSHLSIDENTRVHVVDYTIVYAESPDRHDSSVPPVKFCNLPNNTVFIINGDTVWNVKLDDRRSMQINGTQQVDHLGNPDCHIIGEAVFDVHVHDYAPLGGMVIFKHSTSDSKLAISLGGGRFKFINSDGSLQAPLRVCRTRSVALLTGNVDSFGYEMSGEPFHFDSADIGAIICVNKSAYIKTSTQTMRPLFSRALLYADKNIAVECITSLLLLQRRVHNADEKQPDPVPAADEKQPDRPQEVGTEFDADAIAASLQKIADINIGEFFQSELLFRNFPEHVILKISTYKTRAFLSGMTPHQIAELELHAKRYTKIAVSIGVKAVENETRNVFFNNVAEGEAFRVKCDDRYKDLYYVKVSKKKALCIETREVIRVPNEAWCASYGTRAVTYKIV